MGFKPMFLAVDIGNTSISFALFEKKIIKKCFRIVSDRDFSCQKYIELITKELDKEVIKKCVIASVVNGLEETLKQACDSIFDINSLILDDKVKTGIILDVAHPETVGADRIANACAVCAKYKLPAIVIDLGTATTFDIVSKDKKFYGGIIMAGLDMQLKALNDYTSKLPRLKVAKSEKAIGTTTETAMMSGVVRGSAFAIDGLIRQCEIEMGEKATIVLTGGYSSMVSDYMTRKPDDINPNLTLEGLLFVGENN